MSSLADLTLNEIRFKAASEKLQDRRCEAILGKIEDAWEVKSIFLQITLAPKRRGNNNIIHAFYIY